MSDATAHDPRFMDRAIALALEAEADGNLPIGAVIVLGDDIVGQGKNAIIMPTYAPGRHAEMEALRSVPADLWGRANEMVCYTTLEPCMMCMGGLLLHGIGKVIFGAADVLGGSGPALAHLPEYYTAIRGRPQWIGPVRPQVCDAFYKRVHDRFTELPLRVGAMVSALRFAVLGLVIFGVDRLSGAFEAAPRVVTVTVPVEAGHAAVRAAIDDALIVQAGIDLGWVASDPVIRRRLARNLRFTGLVAADTADDRLVDEAVGLGMPARDPVVRRRLRARFDGVRDLTAESSGADWLAQHPDAFDVAPHYTVTQVAFSRRRRGDQAEGAARAALARLVADGAGPEVAAGVGDALAAVSSTLTATERDLERRLGAGVGRQVAEAPVQRWVGPVPSAYGVHLIWVHQRTAPRRPDAVEVRSAARDAAVARGATRTRDVRLQALRAHYDVRVVREGRR